MNDHVSKPIGHGKEVNELNTSLLAEALRDLFIKRGGLKK